MEKKYMKLALKEAIKAYDKDEVPVGAIIVMNGKVITKAHNKKQTTKLIASHAEILAIEKACKKIGDWRLSECVMYVTLEPCDMCRAFLKESRISKVVYGTKKERTHSSLKPIIIFEETIESHEECEKIMKDFFKSKRK